MIPNTSTAEDFALYSVANGRYVEVEVTRHDVCRGPRPRPGRQPKALSATGREGETATDSNTWFWTNAAGTSELVVN